MDIDGKTYVVSDLMRPAVIIRNNATLKEVLASLVDGKSNIGVVVDDTGVLVGAVSTIGIIRAILPDYLEADSVAARFADDTMLKEDALKAAELCVDKFISTEEEVMQMDENVITAASICSKDNNSRIIVVDADNKPVGILTRTEIKKVFAAYLGIRNELS